MPPKGAVAKVLPPGATYTCRINVRIVRVLRKIGNPPGACGYNGPTISPIWRPNSKKQRKPELADRYMAILAQRSTYIGNYKVLQPTRIHEAPDKHSMGGKNLVLLVFEWQDSVECCCRSSERQMATVASGYFLICLIKISVGFVFGSASVQTVGRTPSLGLLL